MAPVAVSVVDEPAHMATLEPALTAGSEFTETVTDAVFVQPLDPVPVAV